MNGPFTCDQLRNIRHVAIDHEFNRYVDSIVKHIKESILSKAIGDVSHPSDCFRDDHPRDNLPPTQYLVRVVELQPFRGDIFRMVHLFDKKLVLDACIIKLSNMFPDMTIIIDPLKTYILFDWSS